MSTKLPPTSHLLALAMLLVRAALAAETVPLPVQQATGMDRTASPSRRRA